MANLNSFTVSTKEVRTKSAVRRSPHAFYVLLVTYSGIQIYTRSNNTALHIKSDPLDMYHVSIKVLLCKL